MTKTQFPVYVKDKEYDKTGWKDTNLAINWDPWHDVTYCKEWERYSECQIPKYIVKILEEKIIVPYGKIITEIRILHHILYVSVV